MGPNYLPKIRPEELCELLSLCSVRRRNDTYFVAVKHLDGTMVEIPLDSIANEDEYEGKKIERIYSSGHVFIRGSQVYLVTTNKMGILQKQFTGGSPREEINQDVFFRDDAGVMKVRLEKVEDNANIRTFKRTGVQVIDCYNDIPLVDWVLMEKQMMNGEKYWNLICLMHFVVKEFEGDLVANFGAEDVVGGEWYDIDELFDTPFVAPNAYIVAEKAREIVG